MLQGLSSFSYHILFELKVGGDPIILNYSSLYTKVSKSHQLSHGQTKICSCTLRQVNFIFREPNNHFDPRLEGNRLLSLVRCFFIKSRRNQQI